MSTQQNFLRQRNAAAKETRPEEPTHEATSRQRREEIVWGKTPGGEGNIMLVYHYAHGSNPFLSSFSRPNDP